MLIKALVILCATIGAAVIGAGVYVGLLPEADPASSPDAEYLHPAVAGSGLYIAEQSSPGARVMWRSLTDDETLPARVVLLVHGLDEPGSIWDDLAPDLLSAGYTTLRFEYPNDQAITPSASLLGEAMGVLRARGVERTDLVCHSMGGLLSRDVLTRPGLYDGRATGHAALPDVPRLIMVGTPNHGSPWATLRGVGEAREQVIRFFNGGADLDNAWADQPEGGGEAAIDLAPGSAFLKDLNSRPLPEGVAITIIAGEASPVERGKLREVMESSVARALLGKDGAEDTLARIEGLTDSLGDGVVPTESTRLEGVDDVVVLQGNHRYLLMRFGMEHAAREALGLPWIEAPAIPVILDRLEASPSATADPGNGG